MTSEEWKLFVSKRHAGRYKQGNANELTKSIITWLRWNGYSAWRNNTMGVFDSTLAIKLILDLIKSCILIRKIPNKNEVSAVIKRCYRKSHERVGASDVIGFHKKTGHFIAVEVKHGKDRLRPEQEAFLNEVRKSNGIGIEARSMEGFLSEFESQKKILFS